MPLFATTPWVRYATALPSICVKCGRKCKLGALTFTSTSFITVVYDVCGVMGLWQLALSNISSFSNGRNLPPRRDNNSGPRGRPAACWEVENTLKWQWENPERMDRYIRIEKVSVWPGKMWPGLSLIRAELDLRSEVRTRHAACCFMQV